MLNFKCTSVATERGRSGPTKEAVTHAIITCSDHFTDLAFNEIKRYHEDARLVALSSPSHLHVTIPGPFGTLTQTWNDTLPIYLHHAFPIQ